MTWKSYAHLASSVYMHFPPFWEQYKKQNKCLRMSKCRDYCATCLELRSSSCSWLTWSGLTHVQPHRDKQTASLSYSIDRSVTNLSAKSIYKRWLSRAGERKRVSINFRFYTQSSPLVAFSEIHLSVHSFLNYNQFMPITCVWINSSVELKRQAEFSALEAAVESSLKYLPHDEKCWGITKRDHQTALLFVSFSAFHKAPNKVKQFFSLMKQQKKC
jgi:hypothetical protein